MSWREPSARSASCPLPAGCPLVGGGGDVEEHQLVSSSAVIAAGELDGISGISQVDEAGPLDHSPAIDVEARDDPLVVHQCTVLDQRAMRFADRESLFVEGLADDHAGQVDLAQRRQRAKVIDRGDATRVHECPPHDL